MSYEMKPGCVSSVSDNGGSLVCQDGRGNTASFSAESQKEYQRLAAGVNANLMDSNGQKLDVNAFSSLTMPHQGKDFATHGAGINYQAGRVGVGAGIQHTPAFSATTQTVQGSINLHRTPNSSLDLNTSLSRTTTPFSNGSWQKGAHFNYRHNF